jgi:hypothetical protein
MPFFTIVRNEPYSFNLQANSAVQVDWGDLSTSMKMRVFFSRTDWPHQIKAVGAQGDGDDGVLLLYKADASGGGPAAAPAYTVRLTDAPQRILFAEYLLKNGGGAKIPKGMVVNLQWDEYPADLDSNIDLTDGHITPALKLLHLLRDRALCHPQMAAGSPSMATYEQLLARLSQSAPARPDYLLVQKAFLATRPSLDASSDPFQTLIPDPFANPIVGQPSIFYELSNAKTALSEWLRSTNKAWLTAIGEDFNTVRYEALVANPNYQEPNKLKAIIWGILINKWILSNRVLMRKAGQLLAIDTLLRNGNRLQGPKGPNFANLFFTAKRYAPDANKEENPVAVINSDTLWPFYVPIRLSSERGISEAQRKAIQVYTLSVLSGYQEKVAAEGVAPLVDEGAKAGSNLKQLIDEFDSVYFNSFVTAFLPRNIRTNQLDLLKELYADDGTLLGQAAGAYPAFSMDRSSPEWQAVREALKAGFTATMAALAGRRQAYLPIYERLCEEYGFDANFDNTALTVALIYWQQRTQVRKAADGTPVDFVSVANETEALDAVQNYWLRNALAPDNDLLEDENDAAGI